MANSGVSGTAGSKQRGQFAQVAKARTDATANADGIETRARTAGEGKTSGYAASAQKTGANGAIKARRDIAALLPADAVGGVAPVPGKKGQKPALVRVGSNAQGTTASSSGHGASSRGDGHFQTDNDRGTKVKLTDPLTG